jgi:hypothetical protein
MEKLCKDNKLNKKIISVHTLKSKKPRVYKYFDRQRGSRQSYPTEDRIRKKNSQALEHAALEERTRQKKDRDELELARQIQN